MQESSLEKRLRLEVKKYGGKAFKFVSPGKNGMPDRIVLLPGGRAIFVEMKQLGKSLEPLQGKRRDELSQLGFQVFKIDSKEDIKKFIQEVFGLDL